jgi:hypothetical protein
MSCPKTSPTTSSFCDGSQGLLFEQSELYFLTLFYLQMLIFHTPILTEWCTYLLSLLLNPARFNLERAPAAEGRGRLWYSARMITVTITKRTYDRLKREAAAWRSSYRETNDDVIFNADRDNGGKGIEAGVLARKLRALVAHDR